MAQPAPWFSRDDHGLVVMIMGLGISIVMVLIDMDMQVGMFAKQPCPACLSNS
jgi:hypothetical protein